MHAIAQWLLANDVKTTGRTAVIMYSMKTSCCTIKASSVVLVIVAFAQTATAQKIDYLEQVKPILKARCYSCHGSLKQESGLRLDTGTMARTGGDSGPAVVAGGRSPPKREANMPG